MNRKKLNFKIKIFYLCVSVLIFFDFMKKVFLLVAVVGVAFIALFVPRAAVKQESPAYSYEEYEEWEDTDNYYIEEYNWN